MLALPIGVALAGHALPVDARELERLRRKLHLQVVRRRHGARDPRTAARVAQLLEGALHLALVQQRAHARLEVDQGLSSDTM